MPDIGNQMFCDIGKDKHAIVKYFYQQEPDSWLKTIHKRGGTLEECIEDTCKSISDNSSIFLCFCGEELAGYFVKNTDSDSVLEGFHILKRFRNKEYLTRFWELVKSGFENKLFYTGIYCRNEPALRCLLKAGFKNHNVVEYNKQIFIILKSE